MPFSKLKGERPNGMGNSSFDIGICVSRCTEGGRAPGFRGRILRVTGTSRVGGLQVGTLYQELNEWVWTSRTRLVEAGLAKCVAAQKPHITDRQIPATAVCAFSADMGISRVGRSRVQI
ncbi:hypothetical protein HPB50_028138 [Hyalomma asiaticum]|nr:hypothetical protein HPB50_028138 [Hyalomma asiaticum]